MLMRTGIVTGAEGLPDIRDVTEESAEASLLAGFQLTRDVGVGVRLSDLPLDLPPEGDIQTAGKAKPRGVAELLV